MDKKLIGISIVTLGIVIIIAVVYYFFFFNRVSDLVEEPQGNGETTQNQPPPTIPTTPTPQTKRVTINVESRQGDVNVTKDDLKRLASSFAERFGSYSNQANYGNIQDLKIFMSASMKTWADDYIRQEKAKNADTSIYYGVTTKSVSEKVNEFDEDVGNAEILVSTQRRMATGIMSNAVSFQQDVLIGFTKEGDAWRVNSAYWQEED